MLFSIRRFAYRRPYTSAVIGVLVIALQLAAVTWVVQQQVAHSEEKKTSVLRNSALQIDCVASSTRRPDEDCAFLLDRSDTELDPGQRLRAQKSISPTFR